MRATYGKICGKNSRQFSSVFCRRQQVDIFKYLFSRSQFLISSDVCNIFIYVFLATRSGHKTVNWTRARNNPGKQKGQILGQKYMKFPASFYSEIFLGTTSFVQVQPKCYVDCGPKVAHRLRTLASISSCTFLPSSVLRQTFLKAKFLQYKNYDCQ